MNVQVRYSLINFDCMSISRDAWVVFFAAIIGAFAVASITFADINSSWITVSVENSGMITNTSSSTAETGGNVAGGSTGGAGGAGGSVLATGGGSFNNGNATGGNGG